MHQCTRRLLISLMIFSRAISPPLKMYKNYLIITKHTSRSLYLIIGQALIGLLHLYALFDILLISIYHRKLSLPIRHTFRFPFIKQTLLLLFIARLSLSATISRQRPFSTLRPRLIEYVPPPGLHARAYHRLINNTTYYCFLPRQNYTAFILRYYLKILLT